MIDPPRTVNQIKSQLRRDPDYFRSCPTSTSDGPPPSWSGPVILQDGGIGYALICCIYSYFLISPFIEYIILLISRVQILFAATSTSIFLFKLKLLGVKVHPLHRRCHPRGIRAAQRVLSMPQQNPSLRIPQVH